MEAAPTSTEIEVVQPAALAPNAKKPRAKRVSDHKLDQALRDIDLLSISAKDLRGYSVIGRFLDQIGIVDYGNGRLVGTAAALEKAMKACADVVANAGENHDLKERFIALQLRLAKAIDSNITLVSKGQEGQPIKKPLDGQQAKPFSVGQIIVPVQINQVSPPDKPV